MSKGAGSGRGTDAPPAAVADGTGSHTTAKDDDSGLIDIKSMARKTKRRVTSRLSTETDVEESLLASSRPSALRDVVLPDPDKAQPVRLATEADEGVNDAKPEAESSKGGTPWIALAAAVVLIGGGAAAWFATRGGSDTNDTRGAANEQTVARGDMPASPGGGEPPSVTEGETPEPGGVATDDIDEEPGTDPSADPAPPVAPDPAKAKPAKADPKKVAKADRRGKKADRKPDAKRDKKMDTPKKKPEKVNKKPKGDLDSLLDRAAGEKRDKKVDKKVENKPVDSGKTKLARGDIQKGMRSVKGRVAACYERFKQPGTVKVKVTISNTGVVTKATATGKFKGTDTGACVSKAVSTATFPEFSGPSMSLSYPFLLQ